MPIELTDLGTATLGFPLNGGAIVGDRLVVSSRNLLPARLAVLDLATRSARQGPTIPTGSGAWALQALSNTRVAVGQSNARGAQNLYVVELEGDSVTPIATFDVDYVWSMSRLPDGRLVLGTAPDQVLVVDPATGAALDLGLVDPAAEGVRAVAVAGDQVVVGGRSPSGALLRAVGVDGAGRREILPPELAGDSIVYALAVGAGRLVAGTRGPGNTAPALGLLDDASLEPVAVTRLDADETTFDAVAVTTDAVWATARPSGTLYRTGLDGGGLEEIATPVPASETRMLAAHQGRVWGVSAAEDVWVHDPAAGTTEVVSLLEEGIQAAPEKAQSLAVGGGTVSVGGNFGLQVRRVSDRVTLRHRVPGEPKCQLVVGATRYLGIYPVGELWSGPTDLETAPTRLARLGAEQNRPLSLAHDATTGLVCCGTSADRRGGGALHLHDPGAQTTESVLDPIAPDQFVSTITCEDGVAYLGGGAGAPSLVAWDLRERRETWRVALGGDLLPVTGIALHQGLVWALTQSGTLVAVDAAERRVRNRWDIAPRGGQIAPFGATLTAVDPDSLYDVAPATVARADVVRSLDSQIWGNPFLTVDGEDRYVIRGTSVLRVSGVDDARQGRPSGSVRGVAQLGILDRLRRWADRRI